MNLELNNDLLKSIECPTCMEYMAAPIYICIKGHSLCKLCWSVVQVCPSCSRELSSTRNYLLEEVAEKLFYPCPNEDYGCLEKFHLNDVKEHVKMCSCRKYKCALDSMCKWQGRTSKLYQHALEDHPKKTIREQEQISLVWEEDAKKNMNIVITSAFNQLFYIENKLLHDILYIWLRYLGKSEDAVQFGYQVIFTSEESKNRTINFKEICQNDLKTQTEIISSGRCVVIPLVVLRTFQNRLGTLFYNIVILKL